jgi:putative oxidoreductase
MSEEALPNTVSAAPLGPAGRVGNTAFATSLAILILRLVLGWTFVFHGSQKLFGAFGGHGIEGFAQGLANMGLPGFLPPTAWAYLAAGGEFLGGLAVLLGLLARLGTIPIIVSMLVAIAKVHGVNGFGGWTEMVQDKMDKSYMVVHVGYEFNLALIAMCLVVLIAGPGLVSLDALIFKRGLWARGPQPLSEPGRRG